MSVYTEYKTNLYTRAAMGCVTNENASNIYADSIPLSAVRERFEAERAAWYATSYDVPGTEDGVNPDGTIHYSADVHVTDPNNVTCVRLRDGKIHGRFGADSGLTRRQYEFLLDLASGITREGLGELLITGAGTTGNGARGYVQFSTSNVSAVAGMEFSPFVTLGMSHDGSIPTISSRGSLIIACANQVAGLYGAAKATGARVKQTRNRTDASIITAHTVALGIEHERDDMSEAIATMAALEFGPDAWTLLLDTVAPVNVENASKNQETRNENIRGVLSSFWKSDPRVAPWSGSVLGAVQALNTFDTWERGTRGETDSQTRMTDEFLRGVSVKRENERASTVAKVLSLVSA